MSDQLLQADEIHQMAFEEGQPADNGDGYLFTCEEFELFVERLLTRAQPAAIEPKPVAYLDEKDIFVLIGEAAFRRSAFIDGPDRAIPCAWRPIFTHPAPAGVVLPDECTRRTSDIRDEAYDNGWNACLDEVARLNGVKP